MRPFCLIAGDAHPALARQVAELAGASLVPATVGAFADGESRVRIEGGVRDSDLYVVQPTSPPVNERLVTLALIVDAARAAGAARVTAVMPYFGYARQDVRKSAGEPRSAQMAVRILESSGVDGVVALELHSPALESAFRVPLVHLEADEVALALIRGWQIADPMVVSPDAGGLKRAQRYAGALGAGLAVVAKSRPRPDAAVAVAVLGDVRGRHCVIVDDLASTGTTIANAAEALRRAGAASVDAFFVHAVMAPGALQKMKAAGVGRVGSTDSVPGGGDIERTSIAPLLARAISASAGRS